MTTKLLVVYPKPKDEAEFARRYEAEHLPMAARLLTGVTKVVTTKVLGSPSGPAAVHWISEVIFESPKALKDCAATEGAQKTYGHAVEISTGGAPQFLIAESAS
jgi:uncharacterized protein (TIGR02118 family)